MRPARSVVLATVLLAAGCERAPDSITQPLRPAAAIAVGPPGQGRIGPGVREAILRDGGARVIISLGPDPAAFAVRTARDVPGLTRAVASAQLQAMSALLPGELEVEHQYEAIPAIAGTLRREAALTRLALNPAVRRVDLDIGGTGSLATSVPQINADQRHTAGNDGDGVVVGVLDSGIDSDHPDLSDDIGPQACFGDNDGAIDGAGFCPNGSDRQTGAGAAEDDHGHGTHVSGIITSNGTVAPVGVAPGATIVSVKVLDNQNAFSATSEVIAGLNWIITNNNAGLNLGVQVINMSLGTNALFTSPCDNTTATTQAMASAINTLRGMGVLTVVSAGNNGSGTQMGLPACVAGTISVGAVNAADAVAVFSNSDATTDVFAPGTNVEGVTRIVSSGLGGGTAAFEGTSMAAPHVTGCVALLIESGDATTAGAIETRLETSGVQVTDPTNNLTFPRLDCGPTNQPPEVSVTPATQSVQYSDRIADVTVTAQDSDQDVLSATFSHSVNGGAFAAGLPSGLMATADGCSAANGVQSCIWTIDGTAGVAAGTYAVRSTVTDDGGSSAFSDVAIVVAAEAASLSFSSGNPVGVQVTSPGGSSAPFSLTLFVEETEPDQPAAAAAFGDISKAAVAMSLVPVGPGGGATGTCVAAGVTGTGYAQVLEVRCAFSNVPVNTYTATATISGGFYTGGGEDVVTVFDPSLGFTTGGGWFHWPGTTDRTSVGYSMKYKKNGSSVSGSLLMIRHLADGTQYRIKSNALGGLSIGDGGTFSWATFTGKATYLEPGWASAVGNHGFVAYVEDHGEPGGSDRFWIQLRDRNGAIVGVSSMTAPAASNATTLGGGNIVVPH